MSDTTPWTMDQPLRVDATIEQMKHRAFYLWDRSGFTHKGAMQFVAREYADACVAEAEARLAAATSEVAWLREKVARLREGIERIAEEMYAASAPPPQEPEWTGNADDFAQEHTEKMRFYYSTKLRVLAAEEAHNA